MEEFLVVSVLSTGAEYVEAERFERLSAAAGRMYALGRFHEGILVSRVEIRSTSGAVIDSYIP